MRASLGRFDRGLTLVELIVVIVVMAIMAKSAALVVTAKSQYAVNTQADQLMRDLNHLKFLASSWGVALQLNSSSGGYTVTCPVLVSGTKCTSSGFQPTDPATGNSFGTTLTDSVALSVSPSSCSSLAFDSLGRPTSGTSYLTSSPACTFTLSGNGNQTNVCVRPVSGLAYLC